jgi:hypothetical protein
MAINLKEILISDDNNIKLDKVNYNFDQLVANGGGPQGVQGPFGVTGYQGITGYQGFKGDQGLQGPEGSQGSNGQGIWKINTGTFNGNTADTILPIQPDGYQHATSVIIGYKTSDPEYDDTYVEQDSQVVIHRHTNGFSKNLQLRTENVNASFNFILDNDNGLVASGGNTVKLDMNFEGTAPGDNISINQYANTFTWNNQNVNLIKLNSTELEVEVDTKFKDVIIEETLKIKPQTSVVDATDYIAVSDDSTGTVVFKSIADIGGVVPIGTMVSMIPSQFSDNTKFINQQLGLISSANNPLEIRVGAGINEHAGWYICNGKTWTNGTDSFITPDLNSFSYTIDNDPNISTSTSQGAASQSNNIFSIIGGADTSMTADYNDNTDSFDVNGTVDTSTITFGTGSSGTVYTVKRLPQIIFLGLDNLYWSDAGTNAGDTIVTYAFQNWLDNGGNAGVSDQGVVTTSGGNTETIYYSNSTSASADPAGPNNTGSPRTVNITMTILVPSGFSNSGTTITGIITVQQQAVTQVPTTQTYRILADKTGTSEANNSFKIVDSSGNEISGSTSLQPTYSSQSSTSSDITNTIYLEQNEGYIFLSSPEPTVQFSTISASTITKTFDSINNRWKLEMSTSAISDDDTRTETIEINARAKSKNVYQLEDMSTNPSSLVTAERSIGDTWEIGDSVTITGSANAGICYEITDIFYTPTGVTTQIIDPCTAPPVYSAPANGFFEDKNTDNQFTNNEHTMLLGNDFEVYVVSNKEFTITIDQGSIIQLDSTDSNTGNAATDADNEVRKFNVTGNATGTVVISLRNNEDNGAVMATLTVNVMAAPTTHVVDNNSFYFEANGVGSTTTTHTLNNSAIIGDSTNQYPITYAFQDTNESWVNATIAYDGDSTATVVWEADTANQSEEDRITTIIVSIAGLTQNITVTQYGIVTPGNSPD